MTIPDKVIPTKPSPGKAIPGQAGVHPACLVLCIAIILPGMGQVMNHTPQRGLVMVFFMLLLGMISSKLAAPGIALLGQLAGGVFIYALSVLDAYYWARYRQVFFNRESGKGV